MLRPSQQQKKNCQNLTINHLLLSEIDFLGFLNTRSYIKENQKSKLQNKFYLILEYIFFAYLKSAFLLTAT